MKTFKIFYDWYVCLFICHPLAFLKNFTVLLQFEIYTGCNLILPSIKLNWLLCKSIFSYNLVIDRSAYLHILCLDDGVPNFLLHLQTQGLLHENRSNISHKCTMQVSDTHCSFKYNLKFTILCKSAQTCINSISYTPHILLMNLHQLKILEFYKNTYELFLRLTYTLAYVILNIYH